MNWFIRIVWEWRRTGMKQKAFDINKYYTKDIQCINVQNRQEINSKSWHFLSLWFLFFVCQFSFTHTHTWYVYVCHVFCLCLFAQSIQIALNLVNTAVFIVLPCAFHLISSSCITKYLILSLPFTCSYLFLSFSHLKFHVWCLLVSFGCRLLSFKFIFFRIVAHV